MLWMQVTLKGVCNMSEITNWSGHMLARFYGYTLLEMDIRRHGRLPSGPKIIAANHPTTTDPFLLMGLISEPLSILITEMCFKLPVLGPFLRRAGHVPVVDGHGRTALDEALRLLAAGHTVGIFPEGHLSPLEGGLCPGHTGVARLALLSGAPVIPVGIALERGHIHFQSATAGGKTETARWYFHGPYAVTVGDPMYLAGDVEDHSYVRSVSAGVMQHIGQLANESAQRVHARQARAAASARPRLSLAGLIRAAGLWPVDSPAPTR